MRPSFKWPRGLRGQLIVLLLGALVAAQVASLALFLDEREHAVRISAAKEAASRVLNLARELESLPGSLHATVLRAAKSRDVRFSIGASSLARDETSQPLERLTRKVIHVVRAPPDRALGVALGKPDPNETDRRDYHGDWDDDPYELVVSVALTDGRWVNARIDLGRPPLQWAWPALVSVVLSVVAVVVVVWLVVGRIAGPMDALANAAERLGHGETPEPLPLKGPGEVQSVTDAFNSMAERLTRLLAERSRMLAAIGHDLRSPVTAMRIRLEMLEDDESRQRLEACLDEIQSLVEAALALARGTAAGEPSAPVRLRDLLEEVVAELRESGGRAHLSAPEEITVTARPAGLKRAVRNIAENAVRYGDAARIALLGEGGAARIIIEDDGPGIPDADRERVFEPFVRLEESRCRDTGGSGLGLAIARAVIDSHGGSVVLEDAPGGGTRATITLPVRGPG